MKFKFPKFSKVSKKLAIIWAAASVGVVVVSLGLTAGIMVAIPKSYVTEINYNAVAEMRYYNKIHSGDKLLIDKTPNHGHDIAMRGIVDNLREGSKTNSLVDTFTGGGTAPYITNDQVEYRNESSITSAFNQNLVAIWLRPASLFLKKIAKTTNRFEMTEKGIETEDDRVYGFYIPLLNHGDVFQSQTWYIITTPPGDYVSIQYKLVTRGNYSKLWGLVSDLDTY